MTTWLDFESRSPVPINAGTDRYSAKAEAILLSWATDDEPAQLWDIASRAAMPARLAHVLDDPREVLVWHNAQFDRSIMWRCLRREIPIERYRCTRAQAYAHGYPGALETLGQVLQLAPDEQKLVDDKKLIQLFCVPFRINPDGSASYYDRITHPAEWQRFCQYAIRDTEALRAIHRKLPSHNYQGANLATWWLGELINERGFGFDADLARAARDLLAKAKVTHDADISDRTDGAVQAATQRARLLKWLEGSGLALPNLKASTIREWLDHDDLRPEHRFILELRLEASQSSGAKYRRGLEVVGEGSRIRHAIQFSGAGRTGRFCLTGDHEVLTPEGWKRLDAWGGGLIACWTPNGEQVTFQRSTPVSFEYSGRMVVHESNRVSQIATPEHRMPTYHSRTGRFSARTVGDAGRITIPVAGLCARDAPLGADDLRALVMIQADGHYDQEGNLKLGFTKSRKIQRCQMLLRRLRVSHTVGEYDGKTLINVARRHMPLIFRMFQSKSFGPWLLQCDPQVFFDELELWDGYRSGPGSIQYATTRRENAEWVQTFAHLSGRAASISIKRRTGWNDCYYVSVWLTASNRHDLRDKKEQFYTGTVYCAETPTGFFMVRRHLKVWVTGNSGKGFQPHNLARTMVKASYVAEVLIPGILNGDALKWPLLYGGPNEACKNALRGAIVAAPGNELIVADWSNIEGRINAWLSLEEWKLAAYRAQDRGEGVDGYKLLYSRFFGVPIEDVDDHMRQVGKVVDLSCGYLASVGAFVTMAAGYGIDLDELPSLVLPQATDEQRKKAERAWRRALLKAEDFGLAPATFQACHVLVQVYRAANKNIFENGHAIGNACLDAVRNPGVATDISRCRIWSTGEFLIIQLPSGRRLLYAKPEIRFEMEEDPETGKKQRREYVSYLTTRGKGWIRERAWAGLFIENIDQAIANDVLRAGLLITHRDTMAVPEIANYLRLIEGAETAICLHVHDEVGLDVPKGAYSKDRLIHCLTTQLLDETPWARGLPLAASGWVGERYRK